MSALNDAVELPFVQRGGYRFGRNYWLSWNTTVAIAEIRVETRCITLRVGWRKRIFECHQVQRVSTRASPFLTGIRIFHTVPNEPQLIIYWAIPSANLEPLLKALEAAGFEVD